ncbi:hypothetical protein HYU40_02390 [Candidatus Woesearchaeota archaeon]|nr:hypothetical protein [Candidatus Woesearchaeota archaeon]
MVNRFISGLRSLVGISEKEDVIELRELVKAHKLLEKPGGIKEEQKFYEELPNRIEQARQLLSDAMKHDEKLKRASEQLMINIGTLPLAMKREIGDRERQAILIAGNIKQHLDVVVESLDELKRTLYTFNLQQIEDHLYRIIEAVRWLFRSEAKAAQMLKSLEDLSRH